MEGEKDTEKGRDAEEMQAERKEGRKEQRDREKEEGREVKG